MTSPSLALWGLLAPLTPLASATPEPAEVVRTPDPELVTPGTVGFLVTFFVAVALVLLVLDMVRRNRRVGVRAARRDEELRAQEADGSGRGSGRGADEATRPAQPITPGEGDGGDRHGPATPNG